MKSTKVTKSINHKKLAIEIALSTLLLILLNGHYTATILVNNAFHN